MNIVVNTRFLTGGNLEGYGYFIREVFSRMATAHPEHRFYFLFDRPFDPSLLPAGNVEGLVIGPQARHPLLWTLWYDLRVPAVLRKLRADLFISPDGICSRTTRVPQCLVIHDIGIVHHPADYKKSHARYYRQNLPRFARKARSVATVSEFSKTDMVRQFGLDPDKISVVYSAAKPSFKPLSEEGKTAVKEQWTSGLDYFIYVGAIHPRKNLVRLLKAFSIFKKRQQSALKLVLVGRTTWKNEGFHQLLSSYKYRDDVVVTGYLPEADAAGLVASAYALIYPSTFEGFGVPVLEAMQSGVPALTSAGSSMQEIAGGAALYFDPENHEDIADKLMRIYKDEDLRRRLVAEGLETAKRFTWDRTADLLWAAAMKAL